MVVMVLKNKRAIYIHLYNRNYENLMDYDHNKPLYLHPLDIKHHLAKNLRTHMHDHERN